MFKTLSATKMLALTVATLLVTAFIFGIIVMYEPPAFMGYFFGTFTGANWICWLWLLCYYLDNSKGKHAYA